MNGKIKQLLLPIMLTISIGMNAFLVFGGATAINS